MHVSVSGSRNRSRRRMSFCFTLGSCVLQPVPWLLVLESELDMKAASRYQQFQQENFGKVSLLRSCDELAMISRRTGRPRKALYRIRNGIDHDQKPCAGHSIHHCMQGSRLLHPACKKDTGTRCRDVRSCIYQLVLRPRTWHVKKYHANEEKKLQHECVDVGSGYIKHLKYLSRTHSFKENNWDDST